MPEIKPTQRAWDVVQSIEHKTYQLPSIQRFFVWDQFQILRLLDSIMCSYPIGALMVWRPPDKIRCRPFVQTYDSQAALSMRSQLPPASERHAYMVLDGQQRLQSLYLAFKGRYDGKRVYLRIDSISAEGDGGLHYSFDFLTDKEATSDTAWVALDELAALKVKDINKFVRNRLDNRGDVDPDRAVEIVSTFVDAFAMREGLLFQEIDQALDYNNVLEVFERVNSGGTPLSRSDLLFSTMKLKLPDAEERFLQIVDDLNDNGRHDFTPDFVIKACFVLFGKGAKYDYAKLNDPQFLQLLVENFGRLEKTITALRVWLDQKAQIKSGRFLRSKLALIPLLDYLMQNNKKLGPAEGKESVRMRQYLYMSFFTRVFSRAPDAILDQFHTIIMNAKGETFPRKRLGGVMARREKAGEYGFRDHYLWDLDLVLNITQSGVLEIPKQRSWSLDRDHIFPRAELNAAGINQELVDDVGNLRLLPKARNISKSDTMPDDNTEFFGKEDPDLKKLFRKTCHDLSEENFGRFVKRRKDLIRSRVMEFLGFEVEE